MKKPTKQESIQIQNPRNTRDKRHFVICPKCGGTDINYMATQLRITKYIDNKAVKTATTTIKSKSSTLCCTCLYEKGTMI